MRTPPRVPLALLLLLLLPPATPAASGDDVVMRALADELRRSMEQLRLEELDRPYFIAYRVDEVESVTASASFGSLVSAAESRSRTLSVELRVGDYELDNTNFLTLPSFATGMVRSFGGFSALTLDDDYQEIRRQVWLATDAAFKNALEQLAQKRAVLQSKTPAEELDDFSRAEAMLLRDERARTEGDLAELSNLVTGLSALFREFPGIFNSSVSCSATTIDTRFVNSEGTRYRRVLPGTRLLAEAVTQATDGMPLRDFFLAQVELPRELPSADELAAEVRSLGSRLEGLRNAELLDRYNGPVLFEGQAAAELFSQVFARKLLTLRRPLAGDARFAAMLEQGRGNELQDRIGARVLPRFLSVTDDPTLREYEGTPLQGSYTVDDQGVPARSTAVIERGYLKTLLSGRTPVVGVEHSSGNWRGGGVVPGNLIVSADDGLSAEELRQELLLLVEDRGAEFGVVVRRLGNPNFGYSQEERIMAMIMSRSRGGAEEVSSAIAAFKIYADGRQVPLRNVEISGLTASSFKQIVGGGEAAAVYSIPFKPAQSNPFGFASMMSGFPGQGGGAGGPTVSVVVPALLFEEVTLKKPSDEIPTRPVSAHPFFDEAS